MEMSKLREILCSWLGIKRGTIYWISRVEIMEGIDKGQLRDVYLVKGSKSKERYVVFYDYINDYVSFAYDYQDWDV